MAIAQVIDFLNDLVRLALCRLALRLLVQPTIAAKGGICSSTTISGSTSSSHVFGLSTVSLPIDAQPIQRHNYSGFGLHRWLRGRVVYGRKSVYLRLSGHSPRSSPSTDIQSHQLARGLGPFDGHCPSLAQRCRK